MLSRNVWSHKMKESVFIKKKMYNFAMLLKSKQFRMTFPKRRVVGARRRSRVPATRRTSPSPSSATKRSRRTKSIRRKSWTKCLEPPKDTVSNSWTFFFLEKKHICREVSSKIVDYIVSVKLSESSCVCVYVEKNSEKIQKTQEIACTHSLSIVVPRLRSFLCALGFSQRRSLTYELSLHLTDAIQDRGNWFLFFNIFERGLSRVK